MPLPQLLFGPRLLFCFVLFKDLKHKLCCLTTLGIVSFHCNIDYLFGITFLKKGRFILFKFYSALIFVKICLELF